MRNYFAAFAQPVECRIEKLRNAKILIDLFSFQSVLRQSDQMTDIVLATPEPEPPTIQPRSINCYQIDISDNRQTFMDRLRRGKVNKYCGRALGASIKHVLVVSPRQHHIAGDSVTLMHFRKGKELNGYSHWHGMAGLGWLAGPI